MAYLDADVQMIVDYDVMRMAAGNVAHQLAVVAEVL